MTSPEAHEGMCWYSSFAHHAVAEFADAAFENGCLSG
jgi:hypothetical protein